MLMMKLNWVVLVCLGLLSVQVSAQPTAVDPQEQANKERALKGGKISPKQKAELAHAAKAETNKQASDAFLASNKSKPGVVSLASGIQYKVLKAGTGKKPLEQSAVTVRYQGTLLDGSSFDKVDEKNPAALQVSGLLPGLKEAVKLMPSGSKWEIVVPPQLAYGAQGNRAVGPQAVLIYELELVGVN
jgi:FKBP-type peptidyl-prolyl cis-trans isomerase FklB